MEGFEWDPVKAAENLKKHEIDFADAAVALADPLALTIDDPDAEDEERFISLTMGPDGVVLVTVYTYVEENIRIISSRKASSSERKTYEAGYA